MKNEVKFLLQFTKKNLNKLMQREDNSRKKHFQNGTMTLQHLFRLFFFIIIIIQQPIKSIN